MGLQRVGQNLGTKQQQRLKTKQNKTKKNPKTLKREREHRVNPWTDYTGISCRKDNIFR